MKMRQHEIVYFRWIRWIFCIDCLCVLTCFKLCFCFWGHKKCLCLKYSTSLLLFFLIFLVLPTFSYLISSHIPTQFLLFSLFRLSFLSLIISVFFNFGISLFVCTTKQKKEQIDISFCKKKKKKN